MQTSPDEQSFSQAMLHDPVQRWAASTHGQKLTTIESAEVARLVPDLFGRHFLQIGHWGSANNWLDGSEMLHRAVLTTHAAAQGQVRIDPQLLPLAARSIDAILLPHTLESTGSPHTLLREVSRVLSERGRLLILGFNPWSLLGLRRWMGLAPRALPSNNHFYSAGRVSDWLTLLDFEITSVRRFGSGFPWLPPRDGDALFSPAALLQPFSEGYLIAAKKRVAPLNRIGRSQRAQIKPLITAPVANTVRRETEIETPSP